MKGKSYREGDVWQSSENMGAHYMSHSSPDWLFDFPLAHFVCAGVCSQVSHIKLYPACHLKGDHSFSLFWCHCVGFVPVLVPFSASNGHCKYKKKTVNLDFAMELKVIQHVEAGEKKSTVAHNLGIQHSTLSTSLKNKEKTKLQATEQRGNSLCGSYSG